MSYERMPHRSTPLLLEKSDRFMDHAPAAPPADWTSEIWLPEPFEPRYAYPLLVWLHDAGESELDAAAWAEATGMQNLLVLSVRGTLTRKDGGFDWPADGDAVWKAVSEELSQLPPELRYDERRITLAGHSAGARAAFAAWRCHPRQIAGACLVSPGYPDDQPLLHPAGSGTLGGRLWVGGFGAAAWQRTAQAAYALGTDVRIDSAASVPGEVGPALNEWVMRSIPTAVLA